MAHLDAQWRFKVSNITGEAANFKKTYDIFQNFKLFEIGWNWESGK